MERRLIYKQLIEDERNDQIIKLNQYSKEFNTEDKKFSIFSYDIERYKKCK